MNDSGLVEKIHASPRMAVIAVTGAGSQALASLLAVPGASRTLLEAIVPYGQRSMAQFLGEEPAQYVAVETAKQMARRAYVRALSLREAEKPVVGLACTATIATDRPKRGEHRCCLATWDESEATTYDLVLAKGQRDRPGEETVVSRLVLNALAESCHIGARLPLGLLAADRLEVQRSAHLEPVGRLLSQGQAEGGAAIRTLTVYPDGGTAVDEPPQGAVLPGSFSPLHSGHEQLAQTASEMLGVPVFFELSVVNVDKPPLEEEEVRARLRQFHGKWAVVLTRAPTFREKASLFPGCTLVIGWDTAVRLVHPRYYGGQEHAVHAALGEIRALDCRFLVAGRVENGVFRTLKEVTIPPQFAEMFQEIPESRFRADISATELRPARSLL